MKRGVTTILLFLSLILTLTIASAAPELILQNEAVQPGETILGKITLFSNEEFTAEISKDDIKFLEGRRQVSFEYDVAFDNNANYLYVYANREGNFTIKTNPILYRDKISKELKELTIEKQITIVESPIIYQEEINESGNLTTVNKSRTEILSIRPGFIFQPTTTKQESIVLKNLGDSQVNLTYTYGEEETELSLVPQETQEIFILPTGGLSFFNISTYKNFEVPIITPSLGENGTGVESKTSLRSKIPYLHVNLIVNQLQEEIIELLNFGDINITGISITSIPETGLTYNEGMDARSEQNLSIALLSEKPGFEEGNITASYFLGELEESITVPLFIYTFPENTTEEEMVVLEEECAFTGGILCAEKEVCDGEPTFASDGYCCIGTCVAFEIKEETSYGWLWGVVIFLVLGAVGYFAYKKFKKTVPKKPEEKLQESSKAYQKRISGGIVRS